MHASLGPAQFSACLATVSQRCAGWQTASSPTSGRRVRPRRPNTHVGFYTTFVSHYNVHVLSSKRWASAGAYWRTSLVVEVLQVVVECLGCAGCDCAVLV